MLRWPRFLPSFFLIACVIVSPAIAQDEPAAEKKAAEEKDPVLPEGHSSHGEVFNEGPRQAAYLMDGMGRVRFDVTTKSEEARQFVLQGIAQLHGFWYFESERSFRQAAMLDPECAIAYWGMAMSNRSSSDRSKGFMKKAMELKGNASRREQLWIESFDRYANAKSESTDDKKRRAKKYVSDLEDLLFEFPDELEAKAFLCEFLWSARRSGVDMASYFAVNALIQEVLDEEPLHPIHHYRIHLWDTKKPEKALESAARCGLAAPGIAHMWHMPGHIYSRLKRYHDAVYQQEASARVDHAHMMKDHVLPDQIHNFAHNNEWCIRNLIHIGRVHDAIDLARNMIELPRHPKYNHIGKFGSYKYGRQRLMDILRTYELNDQLVALADTPYLEKCGDESEDLKRDRYLACAYVVTGRPDDAKQIRDTLAAELATEKEKQKKAGDEAEEKARNEKKKDADIKKARTAAENKFLRRVRELEKATQEIDGRIAMQAGDYKNALELLNKAGGVPVEEIAMLMVKAGDKEGAIKKINDHAKSNGNEVRPLAAQIEVLWAAEKKEDAATAFRNLQALSSTIDLDLPAFARLTPIAKALQLSEDWRNEAALADDLGVRPPLDSLGPFRWQPVAAKEWALKDVENKTRTLSEFRGKPVIVIFYLGYGCLHCAEQLQKFAPETQKFRDAGYEIVAISTDEQEVLHLAYEDLEEKFSFPLVSDASMRTFRDWRCFDDFENQPLHGTFIVDAEGLIRWQDISYEPFMDPDFVLKEAKRLLGQDSWQSPGSPAQVTSVGAE